MKFLKENVLWYFWAFHKKMSGWYNCSDIIIKKKKPAYSNQHIETRRKTGNHISKSLKISDHFNLENVMLYKKKFLINYEINYIIHNICKNIFLSLKIYLFKCLFLIMIKCSHILYLRWTENMFLRFAYGLHHITYLD